MVKSLEGSLLCTHPASEHATTTFFPLPPQTPGPGAYKATPLDVYNKKAPVYTLHNREPTPGSTMKNPGPGAHSPEKVSNDWATCIATNFMKAL
jgi:hypothetical protein